MLKVEEPKDYQAKDEEADTLVIFHATKSSGNVLVSSSDTDVLVLLVSLAEKKSDSYFYEGLWIWKYSRLYRCIWHCQNT